MYLDTFKDNSGKLMGVVVVSTMQVLHLLFLYFIISSLFSLDRGLYNEYNMATYIIISIVLILNIYRYNYKNTYEKMHQKWLNEVNSNTGHKGWLLVLYILLNFSLTITIGILTK
jgi:hypothetical protein